MDDTNRACAVCARPLALHEGLGWRHALQDQPEDHPAVPVETSEINVWGRCDFCNVDDPTWRVPTREFLILPGHGSRGDWAACDTCAELINRGRWGDLTRRATDARPAGEQEDIATALKWLYRKLRKNIRGAPTPLT